MKRKELLFLLLLTLAALIVHGYHPGVEDAEIYVPGIKKILHPHLYPFGAEFFLAHARLTLFGELIAWPVRLSHLPLDYALSLWHLASIFLVLLACWKLSGQCFPEPEARWAGVALIAALLTLPVAGTSLYILDQYLNPRSISAFTVLFAVLEALERRYIRVAAWMVVTALIHPLMVVFGLSYILLLAWMRDRPAAAARAMMLLPLGISLRPPSEAYREAIATRSYFFILQWQWYEWLGIFAPIVLLWWFSRIARRNGAVRMDRMCRALIVYDLAFFLATLVLTIPRRFLTLARFQPMRCLWLLYVLMFLFAGGLLGRYVLKKKVVRWALLFLPLCAGMWYAQRQLFPASQHIEWPWGKPKNEWVKAFLWIRRNTPEDAVFALDPEHMALPGEDEHGFRAIAERSMLADAVKDAGAVTMFPEPPMAEHWLEQVKAQQGWKKFKIEDFRRLKARYGVTWVVLERPGVAAMDCPYQNAAVLVCRVK